MRHRKSGIKLNRTASHRKAMFRNMVTSLFKHDRIRTTDAKAKELRGWADHLITLAKRGDLHARRQALSIIREKDVVHHLFENAPKRFGKLSGGYTRIVKIGPRRGDAASLSLVELISAEDAAGPKPRKKKPTKPAVKKPEAKQLPTETAPEAPVEAAAAPAADEAVEEETEKADAPEEAEAEPEAEKAAPAEEEAAESQPEAAAEAEPDEADAADEEPEKEK